jgi:OmpA-OmpF porin, OOP family
MRIATWAASTLASLLALSACKPNDEKVTSAADAPASASASPEISATPSGGKAFDIDSVPTSNATLGEFPYITLPTGYSSRSFSSETKDFARFPFWVKGEAHWVEGKMYLATFGAESGKSMSEYEVRKSFDVLVQQMGGQKISEEKIPGDAIKGWGEEITQGFVDGLGDIYNQPATTYLIRRADGNIWIHLVVSGVGSYVIAKEKGFDATATPVKPAGA